MIGLGVHPKPVQDDPCRPKIISQGPAVQGSRSAHQLRTPSVLQSRRGGLLCTHRGALPTRLSRWHHQFLQDRGNFRACRHSSQRIEIDGRDILAGNPRTKQRRRRRKLIRGSHRMSKSRKVSRGASSLPSPWRLFRTLARAS